MQKKLVQQRNTKMQQTVTSVDSSARSNRVSIALSGHKRINN